MSLNNEKFINFKLILPNFFETEVDANKELELRIGKLYSSELKLYWPLANKLSDCSEEESCNSAACPVCFRNRRIAWLKRTIPLISECYEWKIVTLIFYLSMMSDSELVKFDVNKLKDRLRKQLKRIGFKGGVIGFLEIDYHAEIKMWMPHFHLLVKNDEDGLERLREYMNRSQNLSNRYDVKDKPMLVQKLRNRFKQISYLFKSYWSRIEYYQDNNNERRTKKYRLKDKQLRLSLRTLDRIGFAGLKFEYGTKGGL